MSETGDTSLSKPGHIVGEFTASTKTVCKYGFFNRHGGGGTEPFESMNVSYGVGDKKEIVTENRLRLRNILGFSSLLSANQVHGTDIYCLKSALNNSREIANVDALITDQPGVGLMIQQADCQAVVLFAPDKKVVAAVHCGWRGSVSNILAKVVCRMKSDFAVRPELLRASISPSLGPCCAEFVNYEHELPPNFEGFMVRQNHFDFWRISVEQLLASGLKEHEITVASKCTCCSDNYFSYRRTCRISDGTTGRNCTVVVMDHCA